VFCLAQKLVEKPYKEGVLIFKIKPEYKATFKSELQFSRIAKKYHLDNITPMFPNSQTPEFKFNEYGQKMVDISSIYTCRTDVGKDLFVVLKSFEGLDIVEYAEPLYNLELLYTPDDPMNQTDQYWLNSIRAFDAWDIHQGDTNIVIGISDTGCDLAHDDLIYNIKNNYADMPDGIDNDMDGFVDNFRGWNFAENNNNAQVGGDAHGAWVSGIAGASTDNGIGVSGAGFKCKILPLKIINSYGVLENSYQSIVYAADHGVDVLNCSWGGTYYQRMAQDVIDYAVINHDMLVVSAAGNTDSKSDYYPASYRNVLSVAGTTELDERWSPENSPTEPKGSSYSYYVDVSAPATMFKSTGTGSVYTLMWGGTSFAAPIVSGCAGILRAAYPDYNANQIAELIKISADLIDTIPYNIPYARMLGTGRMNLYNALTMDITPSIVLQNYNVITDYDYLTINAEFINYLKDATGLTITVSTDSEFADIETAQIYSGDLGSLESYDSTNEIIVNFSEETPHDYTLALNFDYEAVDYSGTQTIELVINPGHKNISTPKLELSIASSGRLGFSDVNSTIGDGLIFEDYFPLFFDCGVISGTSALEIFSSVRQVSDFATIEYPSYSENPIVSDSEIDLKIDDSDDANSRGVEILTKAYSWDTEENQNFIIIDYWLINNSLYDIEGFYFGLFADWDLIEAANNSTGYIEEDSFMYCFNNGAQSMYAGFKILTEHGINNYSLAQTSGGDGVVDISDGFADIEKYYMISNTIIPEETISSDFVQYTGAGPFDILVEDTVRVGIAIIATSNIYDLEQAVDNVQTVYDETVHPSNVIIPKTDNINIYPNPAGSIINVELPMEMQNLCTLNIYNSQGKLVYENEISDNIKLDVEFLPTGLYQLEIIGNNKRYYDEIIISR